MPCLNTEEYMLMGEMMTLTGCFFPSTTFLVGPIYLYYIDPFKIWQTPKHRELNPTRNLPFGMHFTNQFMATLGMVWN